MERKKSNYILFAFMLFSIVLSLFEIYLIFDYKQKREDSFYISKKNELQKLINLYIKTEHEKNSLLAKIVSLNQNIINILKSAKDGLKKEQIEEIDRTIFAFDEIKNKEVWFQILSKEFVSLYRSWDKKVGDSLIFRKEFKILKNNPKPIQLISVGRYSVTYKTISPIFFEDSIIAYIEIIVPLEKTVKLLQLNEGLSVALLIDKTYSSQLDRSVSPKYINGYNLVYKSDDDFEKLLEDIDFANLAKDNSYQKIGNSLVASVLIRDIEDSNMAYFVVKGDMGVFNRELAKEMELISFLQTLIVTVTIALFAYFIWHLYMLRKEVSLILNLNEALNQRIANEREKIREQEESLFKQKRDSAIKELMLNIAHHWRQPLNIVAIKIQSIEDIQELEHLSSAAKEKLNSIIKSSLKEIFDLSEIITKFSYFYTMQDKVVPFYLIDAIKQALSLYKEPLDSLNIHVLVSVKDDIKINGSYKEICEIFLEFFSNIEAIVKERRLLSAEMNISALETNEMIKIVIEDNAGGVDEKILDTIFDPYATTHFKERNKGLGLSLVKDIVEKRYKGSISVKNTANGAKFEILLKNIKEEEKDG